ncbi:MAG: RidA family protein [Treponemataceae bacterium]
MKDIISTSKAPAAIGPYSQGVMVNGFIFTSGQLPLNPETNKMPDSIEEQTRQSILNVKAILESKGSGLDKVVKTTVFLSDMNNFSAMNGVYSELFGTENHPARSAVEVARLPKDALVEIEAIALA